MTKIVSIEILHDLLLCDAERGLLFWRERPLMYFTAGKHTQQHNAAKWNAKFAEREAFTTTNAAGYRWGAIFNSHYLAHRVIFAMCNGVWPVGVDHINGIRDDNRPSNLREATQAQNAQNVPGRSGKTGLIGVMPVGARWRAEIRHEGRSMHIGVFDTPEDAARARDKMALNIRGEFARLNFPESRHG